MASLREGQKWTDRGRNNPPHAPKRPWGLPERKSPPFGRGEEPGKGKRPQAKGRFAASRSKTRQPAAVSSVASRPFGMHCPRQGLASEKNCTSVVDDSGPRWHERTCSLVSSIFRSRTEASGCRRAIGILVVEPAICQAAPTCVPTSNATSPPAGFTSFAAAAAAAAATTTGAVTGHRRVGCG